MRVVVDTHLRVNDRVAVEPAGVEALCAVLRAGGYKLVGPKLQEGAIIYDEIVSANDLPVGWTDEQDGGKYRLRKRDDAELFGYAVDFERDYEFVALHHPTEYPFNEGRIRSSAGFEIEARELETHFIEEQVPYSSTLHCLHQGRDANQVGPMARFNLNFDQLLPAARQAARDAGLDGSCRNIFKSIIIRSVEVLHACEEALQIIADYEPPATPAMEVRPRAAIGCACTEAPRGILFHRYRIDGDGVILEANIVPPTSQNQRSIENDLLKLVEQSIDLPADKLTRRCEHAIRNYDPCISCATHFLKLNIERN